MKIQIKNTQLAEAINIKGIKAQLKKNRDDEGEPSLEGTRPTADSTHKDVFAQSAEKKRPKKAVKDGEEANLDGGASPIHSVVQKQNEIAIKAPVTPEAVVKPIFSTLEKNMPPIEQPSDKKSHLKSENSISEKPLERSSIRESHQKESLKETMQEMPSVGKNLTPSQTKREEPKEAPLFLSATKKNPDLLGPVLDKPIRPAPAHEPIRRSDERTTRYSSQDRYSSQSRMGSGFSPREGPASRDMSSRDLPVRTPRSEGQGYDRPQRVDGQSFGYRDDRYNRADRPQRAEGQGYDRPQRIDGRSYDRPQRAEGQGYDRPQRVEGQGYDRPQRVDGQQGSGYRDDRYRGAGGYSDSRSATPRGDSYPSRSSSGFSGGGYQRPYSSEQRPMGSSSGPRPASGGYQSGRAYPPRQLSPGGASPAGYGRRNDFSGDGGGFRPQPFAQRSDGAGSRPSTGWDRPQPQKEGLDERSQQRRLISQSEIEEKKNKFKDVKEGKTAFKKTDEKDFNSRIRHGFQSEDEDDSRNGWKKRRLKGFNRKSADIQEPTRPTKVKVRIPISVKELAQEMKLKAAQLVTKLFLQGVIATLNDLLDDETILQLLGHEFGCEVEIDTSEQERLKLSEKSIREEIEATPEELRIFRPPVIAFMGHVDHGKTSLIDAIRKTNKAQNEVGAITQHIGAFSCTTSHGPVTILDTPGHEAFSAMRERGAEITDIAILVVAGDEGMKEQTVEAMNQAKAANSTIVVAINKCDKPNFDQEKVYRQLAEHNLLPEAWGGQTITVNCSAVAGEGIQTLLEMVAIQSEILELKADPSARARGTVIESAMYKGLGPVATIIIQTGSLKLGDSLVFAYHWAKVKSMKDDAGRDILIAGPSAPVRINGLSDFPEAGEEFVVVGSEKEARAISDARQEGKRQLAFQTKKKFSLENMAEKAGCQVKIMNVILRADVQGSLEALKTALTKIESKKVELNIVTMGVGEISESDVQLANASKSTIIGFHTQIESHAEPMLKELGVQYRLHDIIYHAQDDVRDMMKALLDKIAEEHDKGSAEVRAVFKSSHLGMIAGCQVIDGSITRNCFMRLIRNGSILWKGSIGSLKRFKDDVKEVPKGAECGILLNGFYEYQVGDIMQAYEITYLAQDL